MAASVLTTIFTEQFIFDIWQGSEYDSVIVSKYKTDTFCHRRKFNRYKHTSLQKNTPKLFVDIFHSRCSWKLHNIFDKNADLLLRLRWFSVHIAKFSMTAFFIEHLW